MSTKPDVILSDGREVVIDFTKVSIREYRACLRAGQPEEDEYQTVGKTVGMSVDEVGSLPYEDYRRLVRAWFNKANQPLADPNP